MVVTAAGCRGCLLPDRPVGTQDSVAGVLGNSFVVVAGNRGTVGTKSGAGQGGMWNGGFSLAASNISRGWVRVPDVPATTHDSHSRLGFSTGLAARVQLPFDWGESEALAWVGGFSHTNCSSEAFLMLPPSQNLSNYSYYRLPNFPYQIAQASVVASGTKLLVIGGSDCGLPPDTERFLTWTDRWGGQPGFGKHVFELDVSKCRRHGGGCEWVQLADFPGTPRARGTVATINGSVYVLGGTTSSTTPGRKQPNTSCTTIHVEGCQSNPLDNWQLELSTMKWTRLPNNPQVYSGNSAAVVVWQERYIITVGVDQRGRGLSFPGQKFSSLNANDIPPWFGYPSGFQLNDSCSKPQPGWKTNGYPNRINVYDVVAQKFGTVSTSSTEEPKLGPMAGCPAGLPLNCFSPQSAVIGNSLYVTGGECDPHYVATDAPNGGMGHQTYWHYPRITLHGALSSKPRGQTVAALGASHN